MQAISTFHRSSEGPNQIVFEIDPARSSGIFLLTTLLGQFIVTLVLGGAIFIVITYAIGKPLIGAALGLAATFALFWMVEWRHYFVSQRYRKHRQIKISPKGVEAGGHIIPQNQITHLELRACADEPEQAPVIARGEPFTTDLAGGGYATDEPAVTDVAAQDVDESNPPVRGQLAERSYLLTMRPRQSTELKVLAGGLTLECGQALVHDLSDAIREKMPALDTHHH
jgi:hypothetical protein